LNLKFSNFLILFLSDSKIYLSNVKVEDLSKVHWLRDDEQIKCPRAAEIGNDDGVDGHRSEEALPRRRLKVGNGALNVREGFFIVHSLAWCDGWMQTRFFKR